MIAPVSTCTYPGCDEPVHIKKAGLCSRHYYREAGRKRYARAEKPDEKSCCPLCGSSARGDDIAHLADLAPLEALAVERDAALSRITELEAQLAAGEAAFALVRELVAA